MGKSLMMHLVPRSFLIQEVLRLCFNCAAGLHAVCLGALQL
jgi:hypothetical protein